MAPCTHPGIKRLFCVQAKNGLVRIGVQSYIPCAYLIWYEQHPLSIAAIVDTADLQQ